MPRRRDVEEEADEDFEEEMEERDDYRVSRGGKRRRQEADEFDNEDDEDEDEDEDEGDEDEGDEDEGDEDEGDEDEDYEEDRAGRHGRKKRLAASSFIDDMAAEVDDDELEDSEDDAEDGFIDTGTDIPGGEEVRHFHPLPLQEEDEEDLEALERSVQARYASSSPHVEFGEKATDVDQQALLPSIRDTKLWMVNCTIGHEREAVACLMQKCVDKRFDLQITSAIALDHLKGYIYVEAFKEFHVKEACRGLRHIYANKATLVPIKEMTDVLLVEKKEPLLAKDAWVRMKVGQYKGDLARVVDVDDVRAQVTVKLVPRVDMQALADKMVGMEVTKKKLAPPRRLMNVSEASEMNIRVEHRRDGFDSIFGMLFKNGFLYKKVSMRSISCGNIQPTFDELQSFLPPNARQKPAPEGRNRGSATLLDLSAIRKKGHFLMGDQVIVVKGDLKNLKGWVQKVENDFVHIKPSMRDLPDTIVVEERNICKYFEPGRHVKVFTGALEGRTGTVIAVEGNVVNILSDGLMDHIRVFSDLVVESTEVSNFGIRALPQSTLKGLPREKPPLEPQRKHVGGRQCSLVGKRTKIRAGPYKGYNGRIVDVKTRFVRVELESQMRIVTVNRDHISDNTTETPLYRDTPGFGLANETPIHPSRTPLHPCMTPARDPGGTPIHIGMRTPVRHPAWVPVTQ